MMGRPGLVAFTVLAAAGASGADVFTSDAAPKWTKPTRAMRRQTVAAR